MRMLVRFGKQPRLRFISHLDLQRFLHMALNRTGLPIQFSQGFNPHPQMAFASALALGWTSEYEVIDVRLSAPMGRGVCEAAMRRALPEDLPVLEVRMVDDRYPSVMAQVRAADYDMRFGTDAGQILRQVPLFLAEEHVAAIKKTKSGEKQIDVRPLALSLDVCDDMLKARLMLTETDTLKADLLGRVLAGMAGMENVDMRIHRRALLGADAQGDLKPLMEL